jgi:hypothetical protein
MMFAVVGLLFSTTNSLAQRGCGCQCQRMSGYGCNSWANRNMPSHCYNQWGCDPRYAPQNGNFGYGYGYGHPPRSWNTPRHNRWSVPQQQILPEISINPLPETNDSQRNEIVERLNYLEKMLV